MAMLLGLLGAGLGLAARGVPAGVQGNVTFHPPVALGPVSWGVTMFAAFDNTSFAVQTADAMMLSTDGGLSYTKGPHGLAIGSNLLRTPGVPLELHDFGNVTQKPAGAGPWHRLESKTANFWRLEGGAVVSEARAPPRPVVFRGMGRPVQCDKSYGDCPIRLQGSGAVAFGDGTLLQSAIVYYGGIPKYPRATSVVCFRSADGGWTWDFQGVVANASDYVFSQEGPNEHDLAMLSFGQVLAVVRLDAGDGRATHPYVDYYYTVSLDGGRTWPKMQPMAGTGCARPRLLMLGGGYAPLLMSGGRMKNNGSDDNLLWVDWKGESFPAAAPSWETFALSYYHNLLAPPGMPRYTAAVNSTTAEAETAAYTALVAVGRCSAVVLYDLVPAKGGGGRQGFSMRVDLHLDEGGEIGVHC